MGSWFSNLHIRKSSTISETMVVEYIRKAMMERQCLPAVSEEAADGAFAIVTDEKSQWYSVYSDLFSFDEPKLFVDYAAPMSEELKTDVIGFSCFDSDFLYLNLINKTEKVDAWAGVGRASGFGIRKRTNFALWKKKISDFERFKQSVNKDFVFAEDVLAEIEPCIHLPKEYSAASFEYLADMGLREHAKFLYFKFPEAMKTQDAPKLVQRMESFMPCALDNPSIVSGINVGGASKGLSVYFVGDYVENEEITFSDVCFVKCKNNMMESVPFALKKVQLSDGQWAYYYHDPGYKILPKVDDRLPMMKRMRIEDEHVITVRFVPHGNPRKILDITVALVPDKNPQGQTGWNVWQRFGSKKAYIQFINSSLSQLPNYEDKLLREEDYD